MTCFSPRLRLAQGSLRRSDTRLDGQPAASGRRRRCPATRPPLCPRLRCRHWTDSPSTGVPLSHSPSPVTLPVSCGGLGRRLPQGRTSGTLAPVASLLSVSAVDLEPRGALTACPARPPSGSPRALRSRVLLELKLRAMTLTLRFLPAAERRLRAEASDPLFPPPRPGVGGPGRLLSRGWAPRRAPGEGPSSPQPMGPPGAGFLRPPRRSPSSARSLRGLPPSVAVSLGPSPGAGGLEGPQTCPGRQSPSAASAPARARLGPAPREEGRPGAPPALFVAAGL